MGGGGGGSSAIAFPSNPTAGQSYTYQGKTYNYTGVYWRIVSDIEVAGTLGTISSSLISTTVSGKSANYSIQASDKNTLIRSIDSAITITIDDVLSVGERVDFAQYGSGQITFAAGTGVTLNSADGNLKTAKQYAGATVQCVASGVYWLVGNLGA